MRDSIFKSTQDMPPKENSSDVVRVAQTKNELLAQNHTPVLYPSSKPSVENVQRPRRGYGY